MHSVIFVTKIFMYYPNSLAKEAFQTPNTFRWVSKQKQGTQPITSPILHLHKDREIFRHIENKNKKIIHSLNGNPEQIYLDIQSCKNRQILFTNLEASDPTNLKQQQKEKAKIVSK